MTIVMDITRKNGFESICQNQSDEQRPKEQNYEQLRNGWPILAFQSYSMDWIVCWYLKERTNHAKYHPSKVVIMSISDKVFGQWLIYT